MKTNRVLIALMCVAVFVAAAAGCRNVGRTVGRSMSRQDSMGDAPAKLKLATTTSTENSGLLDYLLPAFEKKYNAKVQVLSMGTGKALQAARDGNVDVILVHDKAAELVFVAEGWGAERRQVMYNDFLIAGPESDPAGIAGMQDASDAMALIAAAQAPFVSRGDDSGTHRQELRLWQEAQIAPSGAWYMEIGQGMEDALRMANEKGAYVLTDRGTHLAIRKGLNLIPLVQGDPALFNLYGVIAVNPEKHHDVTINSELAQKFVDWIMSPEAQKLIESYTVDGEILFHPMADEPVK
jgi:tungstate transport system substrate-binding protein